MPLFGNVDPGPRGRAITVTSREFRNVKRVQALRNAENRQWYASKNHGESVRFRTARLKNEQPGVIVDAGLRTLLRILDPARYALRSIHPVKLGLFSSSDGTGRLTADPYCPPL